MNTLTPEQWLEGSKVITPDFQGKISASPYEWTDEALIPVREFVGGRNFIRGAVSVTVAPGGIGKSNLAIAEMLAISSGKDLLRQGIKEPQRCWYVNLEDPKDELVRRIQAACKHYQLTPEDIKGRLFIDSGQNQELCITKNTSSGMEIDQSLVDGLIKEISSKGIDIMIIDPFVSSHNVSENDNVAIDLVVKTWARIADRTNAAIHLIHHTRKQTPDSEFNADSARGAKALVDAARDVRAINRMTESEGLKAGVDNHRLYFRVFSDKANLTPPADKSNWYKLESVQIANGDNVGVVTPWKWPDPFDGITINHTRLVQQAIHGKQLRESIQAKDWAGHVIAEILELDSSNPKDKQKIKSCISTWIENGVLKVITIKDEKSRPRPVLEVGQWV